MTAYPIALCSAAVLALLVAERRDSTFGVWLTKPLAAGAYLWSALVFGALDSAYGRWLLVGLALCFLGDVLLIPAGRKGWFRAGIVAFLAGHVAYISAFLQLPLGVSGVVVGTALATLLAWFVWRWLEEYLSSGYRSLVGIYVAVICTMLVAACAAAAGSGRFTIAAGAVLFALSDISVARDRFVARAFVNRLWGLPLYFAAQLILGSTVTI